MKRLRVKTIYFDNQLQRNTEIGEILEVDNKRAEVLLSHPMGLVADLDADPMPIENSAELQPPLKVPDSLYNKIAQSTEKTL